ncbi:hypothetical protein [Prescottella equi]|uniref:hypothetical protein n=1 Tax=Rhodococcus hoagii TaxID=43767 RepID=UPI0023D9DBE8|nr:hypothetical protein [Prescottella equi]
MPIDLDLYSEHMRGRGIVEVLLRGHLWVEQFLMALIEAEVANPEPLNMDRMTFASKLNLAEALGLLSSGDAKTIRILNKMRNRLAHDLEGEPGQEELSALEASLSDSQKSLAGKLSQTDEYAGSPTELEHVVRLAMSILALITEIEYHRQAHSYWREHREAIDAHKMLVAIQKQIGVTEPMGWDEWRGRVGIPERPNGTHVTVRTK